MGSSAYKSLSYASGETARLDELADAAHTAQRLEELADAAHTAQRLEERLGPFRSAQFEGSPEGPASLHTPGQHHQQQRPAPGLLIRWRVRRLLILKRARLVRLRAAVIALARRNVTSRTIGPSSANPTSGPASLAPALHHHLTPQLVLQNQQLLQQQQAQGQQQQQQVPEADGRNSRFRDEMLNNKEGDWDEGF